jgi:hypothetical protein
MSLFSERFYKAMKAKARWREEQRALPFAEKLQLLDAILRAEEEAERRRRGTRRRRKRPPDDG